MATPSISTPAFRNIITGAVATPVLLNALSITDTNSHSATTDTPGTNTFLVDARSIPGSKMLYVANTLNQNCSVVLQVSFDGVNCSTVGPSVTVNAGTSVFLDTTNIPQLGNSYPYISAQATCSIAPASGTLTVNIVVSSAGGASGESVIASSVPSNVGTLSQVSASVTNTSILAANANRKGAYIYSNSAGNLYLAYGTTATTTAFTVKVLPGNFFELPTSPVWLGPISGIWDAANGNAQVTEVS